MIEIKNITKEYSLEMGIFRSHTGFIKALDSVNITWKKGETLGVAGETGCGKTTLAKIITNLIKPSSGQVLLNGKDVASYPRIELAQNIQMIFQDPFSSLNPRMKIKDIITEYNVINKKITKTKQQEEAEYLLKLIGLSKECVLKYPHELSGGQRQRVALARAISVKPRYLICDEPVSSVDVCIRKQILDLFISLKDVFDMGYLFISHDLRVLKSISDNIIIMYKGRIVERASKTLIYNEPLHPYTQLLLESMPGMVFCQKKEQLSKITDDKNNALESNNEGCPYRNKCLAKKKICRKTLPELKEVKKGHFVSCLLFDKAA